MLYCLLRELFNFEDTFSVIFPSYLSAIKSYDSVLSDDVLLALGGSIRVSLEWFNAGNKFLSILDK